MRRPGTISNLRVHIAAITRAARTVDDVLTTTGSQQALRLLDLAGHHGFLVVFDDPHREATTARAAPRNPHTCV